MYNRDDQLAKKPIIASTYLPGNINICEIINLINGNIFQFWIIVHINSLQEKGSFNSHIHLPFRQWFSAQFCRSFIITSCRLIFEHNLSSSHLHRIEMESAHIFHVKQFRRSRRLGDLNHLLLACLFFARSKNQCFKNSTIYKSNYLYQYNNPSKN